MADFAGTGTGIPVSKKYRNLAGTGTPVVHYCLDESKVDVSSAGLWHLVSTQRCFLWVLENMFLVLRDHTLLLLHPLLRIFSFALPLGQLVSGVWMEVWNHGSSSWTVFLLIYSTPLYVPDLADWLLRGKRKFSFGQLKVAWRWFLEFLSFWGQWINSDSVLLFMAWLRDFKSLQTTTILIYKASLKVPLCLVLKLLIRGYLKRFEDHSSLRELEWIPDSHRGISLRYLYGVIGWSLILQMITSSWRNYIYAGYGHRKLGI